MKIEKILPGLLLVYSVFILNGCCNPEIIGNVPNTLQPQQTNNWCWAATTQMLAQNAGISVNQCDLANHRFSKSNCCDPQVEGRSCPKTNDCNSPGSLELDFVGLKFTQTTTPRTWEEMRSQIYCAKKPMGYSYGTPGVTGHVLVVKGYVTVGGTNYLVLNDPSSPCEGEERLITYEEYVDPAGSRIHRKTTYDIAKK
jgi:hypothetical protein